MSGHPKCPVCGGSDYTKESGFFFCNECQTQSQEVFVEVVDDEVGVYSRSSVVSGSSAGSQKTERQEYTSWESYNFVLKGLVEELISLGAPADLQDIVLQLWVRYLQKNEVGFSVRDSSRLPKLGLSLQKRKRDAKIIYKHKMKRKRRRKTQDKEVRNISDDEESESSFRSDSQIEYNDDSSKDPSNSDASGYIQDKAQRAKFRKLRRSLIKTEYGQYQSEAKLSISELSDDMLSQLSDDTQTNYSEMTFASSDESEMSVNKNELSQKAKKRLEKKFGKKVLTTDMLHETVDDRSTNPWVLSRSRLLALLYLGLLLSRSEIYLGDIIRWVEEENLHYYRASMFLPSNYKGISFSLSERSLSHLRMRQLTYRMASFIGVSFVPVPDLLSLVKRYVKELQLPEDVIPCVNSFIMHHPPIMKLEKGSMYIPNYEARAMAFIIVILKLLFGLDGKTENKVSRVAAKLNTLNCLEKPAFVWNDWVNYINCRRNFLSMYNLRIKDKFFRDSCMNTELFINYAAQLEKEDRTVRSRKGLKEDLIHGFSWPLEKLLNSEDELKPNVAFQPSLTPYTSYLETVKSDEALSSQVPPLLKRNFPSSTIQYLIQPKECAEQAAEKGVNLKISKKSCHKKFEVVSSNVCPNKNSGLVKVGIKGTRKNPDLAETFHLMKCKDLVESDSSEDDVSSSQVKSKKYKSSSKNVNKNNSRTSDMEMSDSENETGKRSERIEVKFKRKEFRAPSKISIPPADTLKNVGSDCECQGTKPQTDCDTLRLHVPYTSYWTLEMPDFDCSLEDFKSETAAKMAASFRWLLSECARVIEASEQDVYKEVTLTETLHGHILPFSSKSDRKTPVVIDLIAKVKKFW